MRPHRSFVRSTLWAAYRGRRPCMFALAATVIGGAWTTAHAQSATFGASAASFHFDNGTDEQALGGIVQVAPTHWLVLGAVPTLLRVSASPGSDAVRGIADLPLYAGVAHALALPWHPVLGATGVVSLPTGDSARGLGSGASVFGAEGSVSLAPLPVLALRAGAARVLRVGGEPTQGVPTTTLFGDAVLLSSARTNVGVGLAAELPGNAPTTYTPARSVSATVVHTLFGSTALMMSAARTMRGAGQGWSFALGFGSAFAGLSPVGATSPGARSVGGLSRPGAGALAPLSRPLCGVAGGC